MSENEKSVHDMAKKYLELEEEYIKSLIREEEIDNKLKEIDAKLKF